MAASAAIPPYSSGAIAQPASLLAMGTISAIGIGLLIAALYFAVRELALADRHGYRRRAVAVGLVWALFFALVTGWGLSA